MNAGAAGPVVGLTREQAESVACPTCGAGVRDECVFTRDRPGGARKGDSMGGSYHSRRADAYREAHR